MSTFPTKPLVNLVDSRWDNFFNMNSNGAVQLSQLVGIANVTDTGSCFVNNCCDLPTACLNTGRILFSCDNQRHFFSDGIYWKNFVSIDQNFLWSWGGNTCGQLSNGNTISRSSPGTTVFSAKIWKTICANMDSAIALNGDGTLWTWGKNNNGQLGDNSTIDKSSPVSISGGGTDWCSISTGERHMLAIKKTGTLWTWGNNQYSQLGDATTYNRSSPGTTAGCGTTWCQSSVGNYMSGAIKSDGTLWMWGKSNYGALGNGTTGVVAASPITTCGGGTNWCQINLNNEASAGIKSDGTLWTWGRNYNGILGNNNGNNTCSPGTISGGGNTWSLVSLGTSTMAAGIKTDGTLWTWGKNNYGQLGDGGTVDRSSPLTVSGGGTSWCLVSMGNYHGIAVKTDATVWTWGRNNYGQLGTNNTTNRSSPGKICGSGGTTWCQISSSCIASFAIRT